MNIFLDANICLDLLDSKRATSKKSVRWYREHKDDKHLNFYFSSDFITTFYYILKEKRKIKALDVVKAIEALSFEIDIFYISHNDFIEAKNDFYNKVFGDFEDLIILNSALQCNCEIFLTNDKEILELKSFKEIKILSP